MDGAGFEAGLHDRQHLALQPGVLLGQLDPLLRLPHGDVVLRRVCQQGDQHRVVVFQRVFQLRIGALHLAAVESPEVQLPGQVEAQTPVVVELERGAALAAVSAADALRLREKLALDDGELGAGLEDARAVLLEIDVLAVGTVDQVVHRGVVENTPPAAKVGGAADDAGIAAVNPLRGHVGLGRAVFRADFKAVPNVVGRTCATAQAQRGSGNAAEAGMLRSVVHGGASHKPLADKVRPAKGQLAQPAPASSRRAAAAPLRKETWAIISGLR